ncbi:hypothetical protein CHH62_16765 [Niallia circulans]|nr:hypothetical protein CHH62_16765 [Niallia circulans]
MSQDIKIYNAPPYFRLYPFEFLLPFQFFQKKLQKAAIRIGKREMIHPRTISLFHVIAIKRQYVGRMFPSIYLQNTNLLHNEETSHFFLQ